MKRHKSLVRAAALFGAFTLSGCSRTPSVDVFGSFFPVWMFCLAGGVVLTMITRSALIWTRLDQELRLRPLVYSSLAGLFTCLIWMVGFHD